MAKMNPEIKALWVQALRSGAYEQGEGYLHQRITDEATGDSVDTFCCLGVLCDLAVDNGVNMDVQTTGSGLTTYDERTSFLPYAVQDWSGVPSDGDIGTSIEFMFDGQTINEDSLVGLNDGGMTFDQIANVIEENL